MVSREFTTVECHTNESRNNLRMTKIGYGETVTINREIIAKHLNVNIYYILSNKFDVDTLDEDKVNGFLKELKSYGYKGADIDSFLSTTESSELLYLQRRTINGWAILVNRGFDTREILKGREDWVTLKRDDLVFVDWDRKD